MSISDFENRLKIALGHPPTSGQEEAVIALSEFCIDPKPDRIFLLTGYAGTGKSTLVAALVKTIASYKRSSVLMAPTGRAAKVISQYSQREAFTIHRKIYVPRSRKGGGVKFSLQPNKHRNTLFIVDEASMVPDTNTDSSFFEGRSLLEDLMTYVYSGPGCQLMFVGDVAQLPPVHLNLSPALDPQVLLGDYRKSVQCVELKEVVRQDDQGAIVNNATNLRHWIEQDTPEQLSFDLRGQNEVIRPFGGQEVLEALENAFSKDNLDQSVVIVRSNKRANLYNQEIRQRILFRDEQLSVGDVLMVVKNNYFWLKPSDTAGFIANGDVIEVLEIFEFVSIYGFDFAQVRVRMLDYPTQSPFNTVLILNTISSDSSALTYDESNALYQAVREDYPEITANYKKFLAVKNNKYFNALQVKYSYAITCHKSQGGQWDTVFVEQPYLKEGPNKDYLRWLYTAMTRAKGQLYLLGFSQDYFDL
jgi:ATP-dependent exoDNAse (exonuclease V) alpha subunit